MTDTEAQLEGLFARFEPSVAKLGKALRKTLRARLPGLTEIVYFYAGQGSLLIAYSPTDKGYEAVCSLAVDAEQAKLFFARGSALARADRAKLLRGSGKLVRYVVVEKAADLARDDVEALMVAALGLAKVRPVVGAEGAVVFKVEEQRQRAVRARKATSAGKKAKR